MAILVHYHDRVTIAFAILLSPMEGEPALRAISQRRKGDRVEDIELLRHEEIAEEGAACIRLTGGGGVTNSGTFSGIGSTGADGILIPRLYDQPIKDLGAVIVNEAEGIVTGERVGLFLSGRRRNGPQ